MASFSLQGSASEMADPPIPPPLAIYGAAVTVALTTKDPDEHAAAARLIANLGHEMLGPPRRNRGRSCRPLGPLIREVLNERLAP